MPMERSVSSRALALLAVAGLLGSTQARAADPIKIGVIAEAQSVVGASIPQAVQLAADEINAQGGVDGRQIQVV
ncbi:MAG: ABC transporter substrate-binding protein, partial [Methylobacterium sp.]